LLNAFRVAAKSSASFRPLIYVLKLVLSLKTKLLASLER